MQAVSGRLPHRLRFAPYRRLVLAGVALAGLSVCLTGCQPAVLDPQGPVGLGEKTILIDSLAIMLAIVLPTVIAILSVGWWFRAGNRKARYLPDWEYSGQIEMIVWAIPFLTIMLLGGVAWIGSHQFDPAEPLTGKEKAVEIQVVSLDWKWLFIYPDHHVASVNDLVIPAGVPVHFALTSASVMNAFFIPQLGSMIYTMNGMTTQLNLAADQPGHYEGLSSHYSGAGFSDMRFAVTAVPAADFNAWLDKARVTGPTLTTQSYTDLARQSMNVAPFTYRDVEPDLFHKIETQGLPPGPGPADQTNPGATTEAAAESMHVR